MKTTYRYAYEVVIRRSTNDRYFYQEVIYPARTWIEENCYRDWSESCHKEGHRFWFETRDDAVMFKLSNGI